MVWETPETAVSAARETGIALLARITAAFMANPAKIVGIPGSNRLAQKNPRSASCETTKSGSPRTPSSPARPVNHTRTS